MFKNDLVLDMVESLGKSVGKMFKNEDDDNEAIVVDNLTGKDVLMLAVRKLTYEKKYSEAEDLIFEAVGKSSSEDIIEVGQWFYNHLLKINDEQLKKSNFSVEEVEQGVKDLDKLLK